jgi:hypothetical protein|tara:strand:+ start:118 stop:372 length:255 start_codon:yes stop_codon:yes gene_type:complete
MNEDIEKYEKQKLEKLKKNNPKEYQRLIEIEKEKYGQYLPLWIYMFLFGLCLINYNLSGPPILYLLFIVIPLIYKKIKTSQKPK